jgi:hypothetical protein
MTRAFPRCCERRETRLIIDCCLLPGTCHTIEKVRFLPDHDMYRLDHGFPVTTILPRPIVAAAMAVHTDCKGAPVGSFSTVRSA